MAEPKRQPLVLLIEDDHRLTPALVMMISDWGYDCIAVGAPADASQVLGKRALRADAVVADLSDGHTSAREPTYADVAQAVGSDVPVIATATVPAIARRNGFTSVIGKPFEPDDLRGMLHRATRRRPAISKAS